MGGAGDLSVLLLHVSRTLVLSGFKTSWLSSSYLQFVLTFLSCFPMFYNSCAKTSFKIKMSSKNSGMSWCLGDMIYCAVLYSALPQLPNARKAWVSYQKFKWSAVISPQICWWSVIRCRKRSGGGRCEWGEVEEPATTYLMWMLILSGLRGARNVGRNYRNLRGSEFPRRCSAHLWGWGGK